MLDALGRALRKANADRMKASPTVGKSLRAVRPLAPGALAVALLFCATAPAGAATIPIVFLTQPRDHPTPVSPLDEPVEDEGLAGARLAVADNNATGRFTRQTFELRKIALEPGEDAAFRLRDIISSGVGLVVADLDAGLLKRAVASDGAEKILFLNARAQDVELRDTICAPNLVHTIPSYAMRADGLAQYLVTRKWRRWFLISGSHDSDKNFAQAIKRAARKFGAQIVAEKPWTFRLGNARADTGHVTLQSEIPVFTRGPEHDVLLVADEADEFGAYLPGRTASPRPVAGTHGLIATGFDPVNDQWGAAQLHERFLRAAGRRMGAVDYAAWLAVRAIGEAATRARTSDPLKIRDYLRGPAFLLSGYKGQGQSFRAWNGQMRQPILIAGPRMLVSVSPQEGFLHRGSELDTLGLDKEETRCGS